MAAIEIKATNRDKTKKAPTKKYRDSGLIPAIVYGQGTNTNILIDDKDFVKLTPSLTKSTIINLKLEDGKQMDVLIKDYQKDHLRDKYLHIDFFELKAGKPVHIKIRLNFLGNPAGVRDGGVLEKHMLELSVECLPSDIIPSLDINIENLLKNESMHVSDIKLDEKFKILSHPEDVVVHVSGKLATEEEPIKEAAEAAPTAEAAEGEEGKVATESKEETKE